MAPSDGPMSLDTIINQMTAANSPTTLNHTLCNGLLKESPNTILTSALPGAQDPLSVFDMCQNTIGVLYIMWVCAAHLYHAYRSIGNWKVCMVVADEHPTTAVDTYPGVLS